MALEVGLLNLHFRFASGQIALVSLKYDHFDHGAQGEWTAESRSIGTGYFSCRFGKFSVVGGVCTFFEKDVGSAAVAEMLYLTNLGGMPASEIIKKKIEGPFRIFKADVMEGNPTGTWHIVGAGMDDGDTND